MKNDKRWAELLQQSARSKERKPIGDGWISGDNLRQMLKMGRCKFYEFVREEGQKGTVERFDGVEANKNGQLVRRSYYRRVVK